MGTTLFPAILAALVVCLLAAFGLVIFVSWIFSDGYKIPEDSIWDIEEAIEDMRDYYRTEENCRKQTDALNEIWKQLQILKNTEL